MKKRILQVVLGILLLVLLAIAGFGVLYAGRLRTVNSMEQLTNYDDYNLYRMDIRYDYSIDDVINYGITDNQSMIDAILKEALPLLPVKMKAPQFGCSAFGTVLDRHIVMGRNYDFKFDTSAMLVHTAPADGYESIGFCALDNLGVVDALQTKSRFACLAAPFACLDGVNEKGVSCAVLTLDSKPTFRITGKPIISTPMAIRLVLDRAATTQQAVDLLLSYDMFATSGRDYHFYITDAQGDGRVIEYDCDSPERMPVVTPTRQVTNFFVMHQDKVASFQKNGAYGHGRERYDAISAVLDGAPSGQDVQVTAWKALRTASQEPSPEDVTSNTQWSIVFDNANLTADVALRRRWADVHHADIHGNMV